MSDEDYDYRAEEWACDAARDLAEDVALDEALARFDALVRNETPIRSEALVRDMLTINRREHFISKRRRLPSGDECLLLAVSLAPDDPNVREAIKKRVATSDEIRTYCDRCYNYQTMQACVDEGHSVHKAAEIVASGPDQYDGCRVKYQRFRELWRELNGVIRRNRG